MSAAERKAAAAAAWLAAGRPATGALREALNVALTAAAAEKRAAEAPVIPRDAGPVLAAQAIRAANRAPQPLSAATAADYEYAAYHGYSIRWLAAQHMLGRTEL